MLIVLLLVTCLLAVGCGKKKVSEEPEADQKALGNEVMNAMPPEPSPEAADGDGD